MAEKLTILKTPIAEIERLENGILLIDMLKHQYTLDQCIEHNNIIKAEFNAEKEPLLSVVTMESMRSGSGKEIRDYFAKPENAALTKASAFVVKSGLAKIAINLFLKFSLPPYPTKTFKTKEKAIEWLKTFLQTAPLD